ncbi:MAG: hypothetical protein WA628_17215 [Terriglobales bacterium]
METTAQRLDTGASWPPEEGQVITFKSSDSLGSGVLKEVRWGLVWRDFILEDGRVIPEHKVLGCPEPPVWRHADEVSQDEREAWEERLAFMAEGGIDPREREQPFWAELNQYLAYIYLKFKPTEQKP